ncbi:AbrB/MazE/SpoVT family DNA-binding domain-containing protein, partial [Candidatus Woesearchaeota archaeon]|nr:AbrB/MazE/SpoVT family DNA-binding domain-containing protein [Candidatus Woesearchaeota archaeon]
MEHRNLIKFGNSSFVISLPKDWIDRNKLKKGDAIFIEQNGSENLIIIPK